MELAFTNGLKMPTTLNYVGIPCKTPVAMFYTRRLVSRLCSAHFKGQMVIAKSLGLKMKNILKPNAVPLI